MTIFPKREGTNVPLLDSLVGRIAGQLIATLARRSIDRGDWHEFNHCVAALTIGSSGDCGPDCVLDQSRGVKVSTSSPPPTDGEVS